MRLSLLLAATLLLTACAGTDAHRAELREYSELEWRDRFIAYRRRCNSAGGFVLVRASNSVDGDGVRRSEHNIDNIMHRIRRQLFECEKDLDPVDAIFWYQLISLIGSLSDQAENVADRLLLFLSK